MTSTDAYGDRYRAEVRRAIGFVRQDHDFFVEAKARHLARIVAEHAGDPSHLRALDVGCGIGLTDRFLTSTFASLDGVDVSPEAVASATRRNPSVRYDVYDGRVLPYEDETFDVAFAVCVVQVLAPSSRLPFVREMARVVKRNGLVVVFEHNPLNPLTRLAARRWGTDGAQLVTRRALADLVRTGGLEAVASRYILFFPFRSQLAGALERRLERVPAGAQYVVAARRT